MAKPGASVSLPAGLALLAAPFAFLLLFFAYPLTHVTRAATLDAFRWLGQPFAQHVLRVAALQAILSVAATLLLALPLAWLHHSRKMPGGRIQLAIHAAPFVMPVFVVVYGLQAALGSSGWSERAFGLDALAFLGPLGAVVLAHAFYNYGLAARLIHAYLQRRPARLEEAARTLGASPAQAAWRVTFPLLFPAILAVAVLVFLFCFASFGVVLFMGQGEIHTLETLLYQNLGGVFPSRDRAAALGLAQLACNLAVLAAYALLTRRARRIPAGPAWRSRPASPALAALGWAATLFPLAPMAAVLTGGFQVAGRWSLEPWRSLVDASHPRAPFGFSLSHALQLSLLYALLACAAAVVLTLLLAYGAERIGPARKLAESLAALPLGASPLLIGLGFTFAFGAGDGLDLRGSRAAVVAVHTLIAFPFTARILLPALRARDARLDEAAAALGAPAWAIVRRVHWPTLRQPLLAAFGFAAAISLADFSGSVLVMRPDNMGLAVWASQGGHSFDPLLRAQAVALTGLVAALATMGYILVERSGGRPA